TYAQQVQAVCDETDSQYDADKCKYYNKLSHIFMYLGIVGGALDMVAARKLKRAAEDILNSPIAGSLDPQVTAILQKFAQPVTDTAQAISDFWAKVMQQVHRMSQYFIDWWDNSTALTQA